MTDNRDNPDTLAIGIMSSASPDQQLSELGNISSSSLITLIPIEPGSQPLPLLEVTVTRVGQSAISESEEVDPSLFELGLDDFSSLLNLLNFQPTATARSMSTSGSVFDVTKTSDIDDSPSLVLPGDSVNEVNTVNLTLETIKPSGSTVGITPSFDHGPSLNTTTTVAILSDGYPNYGSTIISPEVEPTRSTLEITPPSSDHAPALNKAIEIDSVPASSNDVSPTWECLKPSTSDSVSMSEVSTLWVESVSDLGSTLESVSTPASMSEVVSTSESTSCSSPAPRKKLPLPLISLVQKTVSEFHCRVCTTFVGDSSEKLITHLKTVHGIRCSNPRIEDFSERNEKEEDEKIKKLIESGYQNRPKDKKYENEEQFIQSSPTTRTINSITNCSTPTNSSNSHVDCSSSNNTTNVKSEAEISLNTKNSVTGYRCAHCFKDYTFSSRYLAHVKLHTENKLQTCIYCGMTFPFVSQLQTHLRKLDTATVTSSTGKKGYVQYKCPQLHCDSSFANRRCLLFHLTTHDGCHRCPVCELSFPSSIRFLSHIKQMHPSEKEEACHCNECGKRCTTPWGLSQHVKQWHYTATCSVCQALFTSQLNYMDHMNMMHPGLELNHEVIEVIQKHPYSCQLCGPKRSYKSMTSLKIHCRKVHKRLPTSEKANLPMLSQGRALAAITRAGRRSTKRAIGEVDEINEGNVPSERTVPTKKYKENTTGDGSTNQVDVNITQVTVTPSKMRPRYTEQDIREKPFACGSCPWRFNNKSNLNRHLNSCSGKSKTGQTGSGNVGSGDVGNLNTDNTVPLQLQDVHLPVPVLKLKTLNHEEGHLQVPKEILGYICQINNLEVLDALQTAVDRQKRAIQQNLSKVVAQNFNKRMSKVVAPENQNQIKPKVITQQQTRLIRSKQRGNIVLPNTEVSKPTQQPRKNSNIDMNKAAVNPGEEQLKFVLKCIFCPTQLATKQNMLIHVKLIHPEQKDDPNVLRNCFVTCPFCEDGNGNPNYRFTYRQTFVKHLNQHHPEKRDLFPKRKITTAERLGLLIKCPFCPKKLHSCNNVLAHVKSRHPKKKGAETIVKRDCYVSCPYCKYKNGHPIKYSSSQNVMLHLKQYHSDKVESLDQVQPKTQWTRKRPNKPTVTTVKKSRSNGDEHETGAFVNEGSITPNSSAETLISSD